MPDHIIDPKPRLQGGNGWDPFRIAPPGASREAARRVLAATRSTYGDSAGALDDVVRGSHPTRESADDRQVAEVLRVIAGTNVHRAPSRQRTDFNSQLLARSLDPRARASLASALQRLVAAGLLVRRSDCEYSVTEAGATAMRRAPERMAAA